MKNLVLIMSSLVIALSMQTGFAWTADATEKFALTATAPTVVGENDQLEDQKQIYGVQLMTQQERAAFRAKMSAAKTLKEREQIRNENHQVMKKRAESQGLTLPDQVPAAKGMSQGKEMMNRSQAMGQGDGMGSGNGQSE